MSNYIHNVLNLADFCKDFAAKLSDKSLNIEDSQRFNEQEIIDKVIAYSSIPYLEEKMSGEFAIIWYPTEIVVPKKLVDTQYQNYAPHEKAIYHHSNKSTARPSLFLIEEIKTVSYIGDYGAGKTIETLSLLPGEKTTISLKTYRETQTTRTRAENIVDSFTKESADELERSMEEENKSAQSSSQATEASVTATASASFGKISASVQGSYSKKTNTARESAARKLSTAMNKHVEKSNSARNVTISNTEQTSEKIGEEKVVTRQIENINKSRVLNFAFRQLQQEYISITYLDNVKLAFANGDPSRFLVVPLEQMDDLLEKVIYGYMGSDGEPSSNIGKPLREYIISQYSEVFNYSGSKVFGVLPVSQQATISSENRKSKFLEVIERKSPKLDYDGSTLSINENVKQEIVRKNPKVEDSYTIGSKEIKVPGVILNVEKHTLRTPAVVCDAFLGQGEALDSYANVLMQYDLEKTQLENAKLSLENQVLALKDEEQQKQNTILERHSQLLEAITTERNAEYVNAAVKVFNPSSPVK